MINTIIFDVDGTLYNESEAKIMAELLTAKFISVNSNYDINTVYSLFRKIKSMLTQEYKGKPKANDRQMWFGYLLKKLGISSITDMEASAYYWNIIFDNIVPYGDLLYALPELKKKYKLCVLSDEMKSLCLKKLQILKLDNIFEKIISAEEVGETKPSSKLFRYALEQIGGKCDEIMIIGDNPAADIKGGNLAGINTALLRRGKYYYYPGENIEKPDIEFINYVQLEKKIENLTLTDKQFR